VVAPRQAGPWPARGSTLGLSPGREVDDFDAPVLGSGGVRLVLQPRLTVADGAQFGCGQLKVVYEVLLDNPCAPLGQPLVEGISADAVGVAVDRDRGVLELGIGEGGAPSSRSWGSARGVISAEL
jgi:hypothetical protein